MKKICVLVSRNPEGPEGLERVFGGLNKARESGLDVGVYLLGDGVLLAKDGPMGDAIKEALSSGVRVTAGARDLRARGIKVVVPGVKLEEDLEGVFVDDAMDDSDKVITW